MINFKKKEKHDKLIKDDKRKLKLELEKNKEEKNKALKTKQQLIQSQKIVKIMIKIIKLYFTK